MLASWVADRDQFEELCRQLHVAPWLALDTEFHRESSYYSEFCLLQVASPSQVALIDVLAIENLEPLWDLLSRPSATTIIHAAFQDLEIIYQRSGSLPPVVFDTQLAAALLGWGDQVGYGPLVERLCGKVLSKTSARTNWRQRPLTPEQIEYAADDVRYLGDIFSLQTQMLRDQGKEEWLIEEATRRYHLSQFIVVPDEAWKSVSGRKFLKPQQMPVLKAITAWRETLARTKNLPRRWVVEDNVLIAVARTTPASKADLDKLGMLSPRFIDEYGEELIGIVGQACATANTDEWNQPIFQVLTTQQKEKLARILAQVRELSDQLQVAPTLLATRGEMECVVRGRVDVFRDSPWRHRLLQPILDQANGMED